MSNGEQSPRTPLAPSPREALEAAKRGLGSALTYLGGVRGGREQKRSSYDQVFKAMQVVKAALESAPESETKPAITENDKRWRILEHGCQWVSFTPIGGETHSFDPRDIAGLKAMRAFADETLKKQLAFIDEEITRRRSSTKESRNV